MHKEIYFGNEKLRFETAGINERLPLEYRFFLWQLIDDMNYVGMELDYLQVFTFKTEGNRQIIIHSQEEPIYKEEYIFDNAKELVTGKVYVIDDSEHCTMLWAEEY